MLPQTTHRAATTRTTLPLARVVVVWITALMAIAMDAGLVVSGNTSLGVTSDVIGSVVVSTIQNNLEIGNRRLVVLQDLPDVAASNAPLVCGGLPAIVTRTPNIGPNGACFANSSQPDLKSNLSCTCLTYVTKTPTEWTFRLKPVTDKTEKAQPLALDELQDLEIDSTLIYGVAPTVQRLNVIGVADKPLSIELRASPIPGADTSNVALVIAATKATIKSVYVENMDFGDLEIKRNFVPSKLTNLTLRNCKLSTLSSDLLADMGRLQYLDLSQNSLPGVYQDITPDTCTASACPILSMNLSYNQIKTFPSYLLNLDNLNTLLLAGNPLANATIPAAVYTKMGELKQLEIDPFTGNCSNGTVKQVATATICVLNATTVTTPAPSQTSSSNTNSILMYAVIAGCLLVAVLIFLLVKRKSCSRETDAESDKEPLDAYFDNTLSYDETHATISASLLNDPIIITNRLPYKDLRVANCISKGGFGLVYSGVYNRRRVAIKKIRPDRAGDIKQIESFLKEICLIATLNHPRIVEFIGVSWDTLRNLCAVTEFMDRGDLREVLHGFKLRNTPLTWETHKTSISLNIAEGLTYLHSLSPKIVHRDLKSKNVLLNNEMVAKLSDFGISRERHIEETHMTAGIGTSFWIAPEVLLGKDYDERADIFSFGVVLSEIDTDDYPYWNASNPNVGNKAQENMILQMVASGAMRPSFSDTCPRAILELADLCLQVEPSNRPTAAEVAYKLQQIMQFMNPSSGSGKHVV